MQGTYSWYFVVCLALFGAGSCQINWSNITPTQLGSLPPNAFSTITASQIASIPPNACIGFNLNQITVIPPTSMTGFTAEQIPYLPVTACAKITEKQFVNIQPASISGFGALQVSALSCATLQAVSTDQANALKPTVKTQFENGLSQCVTAPVAPPSGIDWSDITAKQLRNLPPSAFTDITAEQLASIPPSSCVGFQADQIAAIPTSSISGLSEQISRINPAACAGFSSVQFSQFQNDVGKQMKAGCLMNLQPSTCVSLNYYFVSNMPTSTFSGFTSDCIANSPAKVFSMVTATQLAAINSTSCSGFYNEQMTYLVLNSAATKLSAACLKNFNTNAPDNNSPCYGIQAGFLSGITAPSFFGFTTACINQIPPSTFSKLRRDQLAAINFEACAGFTEDQVDFFPVSTALGMVFQCLENMNTSCAGLRPSYIAEFTPSACGGFTAECIARTSENAFMILKPTQIVRIPPAAFAGFNQHLRYMPDTTFAAVMLDQLLNLSSVHSNLGGMTPAQLANVTNTFRGNLINEWTTNQTAKYPMTDAYVFKQMIPNTVAPTTGWSTVLTGLTTTTWLKVALIENLPAKFPLDFLQEMPPSAIMGVRYDEVGLIPAAAFSFLPEAHAALLLNDTTSAIIPDQLVQIPDRVFGNISNMGISGLSVSVIANITTSQANYIQPDQIRAMSCGQLQAFTNDQANALQISTNEVYQQELLDCNNGIPFAPVAEPIEPPVTPPIAPPVTAPVTPPVAPPVTAPVTPPVAPPVQAPVAPPVQPPVKPPVATPAQSPVTVPVMSPVNSPSHNVTLTPGTQSNEGLSKFYIIAIGCGAGAVLIAIIAVIVVWRRKRSMDPERQGLLANPNEVRYERA